MPKPRKPTNVLALKGAYKKNPHRIAGRVNEPIPTELISPTPPAYMTEEQQEAYAYIINHCHPDVLSVSDQAATEVVACLLAEFRRGPDKMETPRISRLLTGLGSLGMTPADRSRVAAITRPAGENKYAKFASNA
jgi:hypothetical protein